jgi:hypothetical protein
MDPEFQVGNEQFSKYIDNPNLVMLVVNQHHNVSCGFPQQVVADTFVHIVYA